MNHVAGFVEPEYANNEAFADSFLEAPESIKKELGEDPKRSEFQVEDKNN